MTITWKRRLLLSLLFLILTIALVPNAMAEGSGDDTPYSSDIDNPPPPPANGQDSLQNPPSTKPKKNQQRYPKKSSRKFFIEDTERVDAGIFHVGFAAGGNFWIEPVVDANNAPTGNYHKDFGFQAGAYFDYDYSGLTENVPLALRGIIGYRYILNSVHVFHVDAIARYMMTASEKSSFGIGVGASAAMWYRAETLNATGIAVSHEEVIFLPTYVVDLGFDFHPFMVDVKWLIGSIGSNNTRMGYELNFGVHL